MIDGHGDDIFRYGEKVKVNFSTNIHQSTDHSKLMAHLASCGRLLSNYPEPEPLSVERKLAKSLGIGSENIIVTNGATDAIYLIARRAGESLSVIVAPTFREYQDACRMAHHDITFVGEDALFGDEISHLKPATVWLCNPNNPTGRVFERNALLRMADSNPYTLFVIDQAYADYSVKEVLSVADVVGRRNIIMLQSLTKQFAIPGLRIGYAVGPEERVSGLRGLRMPWAVNSFAIEAANYLLDNAEDYRIDKQKLHAEAVRMAGELEKMGIECSPTDCNFVLCALPHSLSAAALKGWLVENRGLLIRDASNFETLDSRYLRVAAQEPSQNDSLIKGIAEWMER